MEQEMSFIELFKQGGFIMYPLFGLSILAWAVFIQKYLGIRSFTKEHRDLYKDLGGMISSGRIQDIEWHFKKASKTISVAHEAIFDHNLTSRQDVNEKLSRRLDSSYSELKKGLWIIGSVASTTPFVGLFGTVAGIMSSFKSIGDAGKGGFSVVSAGIAESLVTTAAGILIAVIAVIFFNYLQNKASRSFQEFKDKVEDLAQVVSSRRFDNGQESLDLPPAMPNSKSVNGNQNRQRGGNYGH